MKELPPGALWLVRVELVIALAMFGMVLYLIYLNERNRR